MRSREDLIKGLLEDHSKNQVFRDVPWEQYHSARRLGRAAFVANRKKVYLDTNHWISLRDANAGKPRRADHLAALEALQELTAHGMIVIPATDAVIEEVLFQRDENTLIATADLIDELSAGVALVGKRSRALYEADFWISQTLGLDPKVEPKQLVWAWTAQLLGEIGFTGSSSESGQVDLLRKVFDDFLTSLSLRQMMELAPVPPMPERKWTDDLAQDLNEGKEEVRDLYSTFQEAYLDECTGYWRGMWKSLTPLVEKFRRGPRANAEVSDLENTMLLALAQVELGKLGDLLPSMQITCGCYAAVRFDPSRKHKPGDTTDIEHSACALPYCDYFVTDRSNRHLLTTPPLGFDKTFQCKVVSDLTHLLEELKC